MNAAAPTPSEQSPTSRRAAAAIAIGLAIALALAAVGMRSHAHVPGGLEGQVAPRFSLPVITPTPKPRPVFYAVPGKHPRPILLHFWGPSCAPCLAELPIIDKLFLAGVEGSAGWEVVTVTAEDTSDVRQYVARERTSFPILQDADGAAHEAWRVSSLPTSYIIRRDGVIHRELSGKQTEASLTEALEAADLAAPATVT